MRRPEPNAADEAESCVIHGEGSTETSVLWFTATSNVPSGPTVTFFCTQVICFTGSMTIPVTASLRSEVMRRSSRYQQQLSSLSERMFRRQPRVAPVIVSVTSYQPWKGSPAHLEPTGTRRRSRVS